MQYAKQKVIKTKFRAMCGLHLQVLFFLWRPMELVTYELQRNPLTANKEVFLGSQIKDVLP